MSTPITRTQLDRHMEAWRMYYVDKRPTTAIAAHFGVSRQSIRNWIVELGGQLDDDEQQRALRDKIASTLGATEMLCAECDVIAPAHESGLCASCRGEDDERETETEAECALFSDAAFLNNPRNVGRFDPARYHNRKGLVVIW